MKKAYRNLLSSLALSILMSGSPQQASACFIDSKSDLDRLKNANIQKISLRLSDVEPQNVGHELNLILEYIQQHTRLVKSVTNVEINLKRTDDAMVRAVVRTFPHLDTLRITNITPDATTGLVEAEKLHTLSIAQNFDADPLDVGTINPLLGLPHLSSLYISLPKEIYKNPCITFEVAERIAHLPHLTTYKGNTGFGGALIDAFIANGTHITSLALGNWLSHNLTYDSIYNGRDFNKALHLPNLSSLTATNYELDERQIKNLPEAVRQNLFNNLTELTIQTTRDPEALVYIAANFLNLTKLNMKRVGAWHAAGILPSHAIDAVRQHLHNLTYFDVGLMTGRKDQEALLRLYATYHYTGRPLHGFTDTVDFQNLLTQPWAQEYLQAWLANPKNQKELKEHFLAQERESLNFARNVLLEAKAPDTPEDAGYHLASTMLEEPIGAHTDLLRRENAAGKSLSKP